MSPEANESFVSPAPAVKSSQEARSAMGAQAGARPQPAGMELDPSKPHTTIQVRLADGTR
jgi:hypothetical protein